jgi:hypothetical protein
MENLPIELMVILGIISSVIVAALKIAFVNRGQSVPTWVYSIALGVVSLLLALVFSPVVLPPFPSHDGSLIGFLIALGAFLGELVPVLAAVVASARVIYEVILKRVIEEVEKALLGPLGSDIG